MLFTFQFAEFNINFIVVLDNISNQHLQSMESPCNRNEKL